MIKEFAVFTSALEKIATAFWPPHEYRHASGQSDGPSGQPPEYNLPAKNLICLAVN
jgi:hypothetical protein